MTHWKFNSGFAAVWVLVGGILWDGFNHGMIDTLRGRRVAMANAVRQYDPFQRVHHGAGREPIPEEIRLLVPLHLEFDALNALPI